MRWENQPAEAIRSGNQRWQQRERLLMEALDPSLRATAWDRVLVHSWWDAWGSERTDPNLSSIVRRRDDRQNLMFFTTICWKSLAAANIASRSVYQVETEQNRNQPKRKKKTKSKHTNLRIADGQHVLHNCWVRIELLKQRTEGQLLPHNRWVGIGLLIGRSSRHDCKLRRGATEGINFWVASSTHWLSELVTMKRVAPLSIAKVKSFRELSAITASSMAMEGINSTSTDKTPRIAK